MSFVVQGTLLQEWKKLTDNTMTDLFTAANPTTIVFMAVKETAGGTPTLTLRRLAKDGTTTHMFMTAEAVTTKQRITFDEIFVLNVGDKLQAQSSDGDGDFDISITYLASGAQVRG